MIYGGHGAQGACLCMGAQGGGGAGTGTGGAGTARTAVAEMVSDQQLSNQFRSRPFGNITRGRPKQTRPGGVKYA